MNGAGRPFAMPPVVKNIIIANVVVFALTQISIYFLNTDFFYRHLALFSLRSSLFEPHQVITHMFMHANLAHIFFNMFAVFMFGRVLEGVWGGRRMLVFYTICGLGAAATQLLVNYIQMGNMISMANEFNVNSTYGFFNEFVDKYGSRTRGYNEIMSFMQKWFYDTDSQQYVPMARSYVDQIVRDNLQIPTVGASGAVFGLLIAFGMMFPDVELIFIFLPIPIKAKYLIPIYALVELVFGVANFDWDNVAHFAHLGGALFGFILVKYWKRNQFKMY